MLTQISNRLRGCLRRAATGISFSASVMAAFAGENHAALADAFFASGEIPRLSIRISDEDMEFLRAQKRRGSNGSTRTNVLVTVREDGRLYKNVTLHLKGSGSFRAVDQKPALTLSFDKPEERQRFHGLQKISLNNSVHDPSFLCERLGRDMFTAAGVPAPRVTHALVELNGRDLGLYVLAEGWNKQFLRRHFSDPSGNLYERGSNARDVDTAMEVKSGDAPEDRRALEALAAAVKEPEHPKRWMALRRSLDVDRFMSFMALEILIGHWDGYGRNQNNFRIFHDRTTERLVFLPHGMDQLFGVRRSVAETPVLPQMRGLVAAAILETEEGRRRYVARMEELRTRVFDVAALTNRVVEIAARLRPLLADDPGVLTTNETMVAQLLERIPQRHESVGRQLAALKAPWRPGGTELTNLVRWESKRDAGNPGLVKNDRGERSLQITGNGTLTCIGSWRGLFLLEPGRYQFEARVSVAETKRGTMRPEGLATLHSSENPDGPEAALPQTSTNLTHTFTVTATRYVELIADYRGNSGKALFDAGSFRLSRLEKALRPVSPGRRVPSGKP